MGGSWAVKITILGPVGYDDSRTEDDLSVGDGSGSVVALGSIDTLVWTFCV